jgi:hypothetical protein
MKRKIIIGFMILLLGSEFSCNQHKRDQSYSYYKKDTLHILTGEKNEIKTLYLDFNDPLTDTLLNVNQSQIDDKLFVSINYRIEAAFGCKFFGLIDLKNNNWIVKNRPDGDNPIDDYNGTSLDNKYHIFTCESPMGTGHFEVFDSQNNIVKKGTYYKTDDKGFLKWEIGDKFYYYTSCYTQNIRTNELPKLKENENTYTQKVYWINGRDSLTKEYKGVFEQ